MMRTTFLDDLRVAGVAPESVDVVICTHLHVDHVGWNTRLDNGRWVPTFPRARHLFARREWEHWSHEEDVDTKRIMAAIVDQLPPEARDVLGQMWTQPQFFEALGSQIEMICESASEVLRADPPDYGSVPLVVMSAASSGQRRLQADAALARRSTRGRHVLAAESGHWIPLDAPQAVADAVTTMVAEIRSVRERS